MINKRCEDQGSLHHICNLGPVKGIGGSLYSYATEEYKILIYLEVKGRVSILTL